LYPPEPSCHKPEGRALRVRVEDDAKAWNARLEEVLGVGHDPRLVDELDDGRRSG